MPTLLTATPYTNWLLHTLRDAAKQERTALYQARLADATPVPVTVTRHQCPHCRRTWSKQKAATAHIARCWQNPAARGCKTCAHLDQEPAGESCFPGRPCDCNDGYEHCTANIPLADGLITDCPRWQPLT